MADEEPRRRRRRSRRRRHVSPGSSSGSSSHKARPSAVVAEQYPFGASNTFFWAMATGIYWLFLLFGMHSPSALLPGDFLLTGDLDHWLHGIAFFGFAVLLCRTTESWSMERTPGRNPPLWIYAAVFLGCVAYGYLDEETQPLTGRTREAADWEADILGALTGVCTCLVLQIFFVEESHGPSYKAAQYELTEQKRRRRRRRHRHHHRRRHHKHSEQRPDATPLQNSLPPETEPKNEPKPDTEAPSDKTSGADGTPER